MRPFPLSLALLLAACTESASQRPPTDRFVYPSGLVHRALPDSTSGVLYVASANFNRCFDQGTVIAVDLDQMGLPGLGAFPPNSDPLWLRDLPTAPRSSVFIQSYAGEMVLWDRQDGLPPRLFVATRADGDFIHYIDLVEPTSLACVIPDPDQPPAPGEPAPNPGDPDPYSDLDLDTNNCADIENPLSLTAVEGEGEETGMPRAPAPFGLDVTPEGRLWVTHLDPADSPARSRTNFQSYVANLSARTPSASANELIPLSAGNIPVGGSHAVKVTERYVLVSGRGTVVQQATQSRPFLLRVLDRENNWEVIDPALDFSFAAQEARGFALTERNPAAPSSPQRLYMAVRGPDTLLIVNVQGLEPESDQPRLSVVGSVPMPDGPTQVKLVPRAGRSDLVVVSCSAAGVVAIYDPDVGQVVAQVPVDVAPGQPRGDVDPQPFALAVQQQGNAARIFASNFGDGRISVIDIEDLGSPQLARLVAWLGKSQGQDGTNTCQGVEQ